MFVEVKSTEVVDTATFNVDVAAPSLMTKHIALGQLQSKPKAQMVIGNFGGTYKKSLKEDRKQEPIWANQGKDVFQIFFSELDKAIPEVSRVAVEEMPKAVAGVVNNVWLWGYQTQMKAISFTPNCLGMWKVQLSGEVQCLLFDISKVLVAMRAAMKRTTSD